MEKAEEELPKEVSWIKYMTPVRNQGQCGSCYAFAAISVAETYIRIKNGDGYPEEHFSEQQVVDCGKGYGNFGCSGGQYPNTLKYIARYGLNAREDYPYTSEPFGRCKYSPAIAKKPFKKVAIIDEEHVESLLKFVAKGPLAGKIDASTLQFYNSGIITSRSSLVCTRSQNHAITIAGYGTEDGVDYWIVRNSWGVNWGEKGYFRIERTLKKGEKGICSVEYDPTAVLEY